MKNSNWINNLTKWLSVVAIIVFLSGCANVTSTKNLVSEPVVHTVLCWLKEPGNSNHRQTIMETSRSLQAIPGVISISVGEPLKSDREIVDDSFDVAVTLTFANTDDLQAYVTHPMHLDAVNNVLNPLVEKLIVYDYQ